MKKRYATRVLTAAVLASVGASFAGVPAYAAAMGAWGRAAAVPGSVVRVQDNSAARLAAAMAQVQQVIAASTSSNGVVNQTVLSAGIGRIVAANPAIAAALTKAILGVAQNNPAIASALVQGIAIGAAELAVTNPSAAAAIQTAVAEAVSDGTISASLGSEFSQAVAEAIDANNNAGGDLVTIGPDDDDDASPN